MLEIIVQSDIIYITGPSYQPATSINIKGIFRLIRIYQRMMLLHVRTERAMLGNESSAIALCTLYGLQMAPDPTYCKTPIRLVDWQLITYRVRRNNVCRH